MSRFFVLLLAAVAAFGQTGNRPDRLEWFRDQGFGLFIHWSLDSQIGSVISHSMVGADDGYLKRFVEDLPRSFNPRKFHPQDWRRWQSSRASATSSSPPSTIPGSACSKRRPHRSTS